MKSELCSDQLTTQLQSFVSESCDQLIENADKAVPRNSFVQLRLNNRKIKDKKDINSTNGKSYLSDPEIWKSHYIPNADSPGVYLFFNKSDHAIYVGKSETTIGSRVAKHVGKYEDGNFPDLVFPAADFIITIAFDEAPFLAPAFESYLLRKFVFECNKQGQ